MNDGAIFVCTLLLIIWIRNSISRAARAGERISAELKLLRELAERERR